MTLECTDDDHAKRCLAEVGRADALEFNGASYELGLREGTVNTLYIVERWRRWEDLDVLLTAKVVPALPMYNELLKRPFDPAIDTARIRTVGLRRWRGRRSISRVEAPRAAGVAPPTSSKLPSASPPPSLRAS